MTRAAWVALLVAPVLACGGGGGGGGGPTQPGITFAPAGTAGAPSVALRGQASGATTLALDVVARGIGNLYGVAFDLEYPAALRFDGATEGTFLAQGGAGTSLQLSSQAGRVIVGLTRLGAVGGVPGGEGVLLTLRFSAAGTGGGSLAFTRNNAYDPAARALQAQWVGGTVSVQ